MFKMTITSNVQKLQEQQLRKYFHFQYSQLFRDCIKAFLNAVIDRMLPNIDTAMSISSFRPLATQVKARTTIFQSARGKGPKRRYWGITNPRYQNQQSRLKSSAFGMELGHDAFTLNYGSLTEPIFKFTFEIVVFQHWLHEKSRGPNYQSENWDTMEVGRAAFKDYFRENSAKYAKVTDVLNWIAGIRNLPTGVTFNANL